MKTHVHLSELLADDLLLDRLAARDDAGSEQVVAMLAALSRHADTPLRPTRSARSPRRHRALTAMAVLVLGASGVGAAAAVTQPGRVWHSRDSLRMTELETGGATAPYTPAPPPMSGAEAPSPAGLAYALIRDAAGRIVLVPSGAVGRLGRGASTLQAAQAPVAAPGAAQLRAASIPESEKPRLSFFLSTDSYSVEAGKPHSDGSRGNTKSRTPDDSAGDPGAETMTFATTAPEPAPAPTLSAGGGGSADSGLRARRERSTPAAEHDHGWSTDPGGPEARPDAKAPVPSKTPAAPHATDAPTSEARDGSEPSTAATQQQPAQEVAEADAPAEALPTEPVS